MKRSQFKEKIPSKENPEIIFNKENYFIENLESLLSYLELDTLEEDKDSPISIPPNYIEGIMIFQEDDRMCLFDKKYRINLLLTKEQILSIICETNNPNYILNIDQHQLLLINPSLDIKISLVKNGLYAINFVFMCDKFEKGKKISHSQGTPIYNFCKTQYLENNPYQIVYYIELFKKVEFITKMKERLKNLNYFGEANNLEDFYQKNDYLFFSNINCGKYLKIKDEEEMRNNLGYVYVYDNYEYISVEWEETIESAGNSLKKESQNTKKSQNSQNTLKIEENLINSSLNLNSNIKQNIDIENEQEKIISQQNISSSSNLSDNLSSDNKDEKNISKIYNLNCHNIKESYQESDSVFSFHDLITDTINHNNLGTYIKETKPVQEIIQEQHDSEKSKKFETPENQEKTLVIEWDDENIKSAGNTQKIRSYPCEFSNSNSSNEESYNSMSSNYSEIYEYQKNTEKEKSGIYLNKNDVLKFENLENKSKNGPTEKNPNRNNNINSKHSILDIEELKNKHRNIFKDKTIQDLLRVYSLKKGFLDQVASEK